MPTATPPIPAPSRASGPILVASHERSGTHLLLDLLRRNFPACRARPAWGRSPHDWLYLSIDRLNEGHPRPVTTAFADATLARAARPLLKSHALPGFADVRPDARAWLDKTMSGATMLYALRDGRAVMPAFHRHRFAVDPATPREFAVFLRTEIDGRTPPVIWADHVTAWAARPGVHVVRFEAMTSEPETVLQSLAIILGESADSSVASVRPPRGVSPWAARLARLTGRLESSNLPERGPRTPRWHELFTDDDLTFFEEHAGETLGHTRSDGLAPAPSSNGGSAA